MVTLPPIAETIYLSVDKAIHGLCPLDRPQETPRVSWVDGLRILLGQTGSTLCRPREAGSAPAAGVALAVGNFDGVHLGHAEIVRRLRATAARLGAPAAVLTFDPHPAAIVRPGAAPMPLTTPERRAELLLALGLDAVLVQPVDDRFVSLEAETFYHELLRGRLRARALVEGADFRFGRGRRGDVGLLARLAAADGVVVEVVPPVAAGDAAVSSSRVRGLVAAGDVAAANRLLTAPLRVRGTVVHGAHRGAALGFPTANLAGIATLLPAAGVYAARAVLPDGRVHAAAVHIGPNASFGETALSVEAHLIGFAGDLYDSPLDVDFLARLRDTRRFDAIDDLLAQMRSDVEAAARIAAPPATAPAPRSDHAS
jgi:riboflavin kinase/FMN adenylyltransferase